MHTVDLDCDPETYDTLHVYAWPDLSWCYADSLEQALQYMSDDYVKLAVRFPCDIEDEVEIDDIIQFAVGTYFGK